MEHEVRMIANKSPRVVALVGQKGGCGKTTIAVHITVAAQDAGEHVGIFDCDPQASAFGWVECRTNRDPAVASITPTQVYDCLDVARKKNLSLVVIDTAPHATTDIYSAICMADLVLLPCRPSILDLKAIAAAVTIAKASKRPSAFVINAAPPRSPEVAFTRTALETFTFPIAPITIGHRQSYLRAMASGQAVTEFEPDGQAAAETRDLWKWVQGVFA
jgi:chromosome partitioning protein